MQTEDQNIIAQAGAFLSLEVYYVVTAARRSSYL